MLYEGLFRSAREGYLEPGLVDNYTLSADKKTYRFTLKPTRWSDGSSVTAYDFETTWKSQLDPAFPAPYRYLFFSIKNVENYKAGKVPLESVGIHALDPHTLEIALEAPKESFLELLSFSAFFPYKEGCSNGPYLLEKKSPHHRLILKKNRYYHDKENVDVQSLEIRIIDSENTAYQLFCEKKLDILGGPLAPIPQDAAHKHYPDYHALSGSTLCAFNTQSPLFKNSHLRKAFALAIDYNELSRLFPHSLRTTNSFLPAPFTSSPNPFFAPHEPSTAQYHLRLALTELGISSEELSHSLTYYFGAKPEHARLAQVLQACWKKNLGIEVNLMTLEHRAYSAKLAKKEFDIAQVIWLAPYKDPSALLDRFTDRHLTKNFSNFSDPELNCILASLNQGTLSQEEALEKIEFLLANNLPFIPLCHWQYPYLLSDKIQSLPFTELGTPNFTYLKIAH